jgi:hypothetical protein
MMRFNNTKPGFRGAKHLGKQSAVYAKEGPINGMI